MKFTPYLIVLLNKALVRRFVSFWLWHVNIVYILKDTSVYLVMSVDI